ncbi:two-partner secretion domain-containing protein [Methyloversatilis thermotolerans]|uniref:two-partner secretion domain-containing protein n=1 Tax=Methyloversatilis thermotolerans TaxID=1346290 RepID=UPI000362A65B|nr:filamentous haemagglutinin family protein [Methyloversatilis thermotolerans]
MNRNRYRLLFNELTASWVAVPETASTRGKRSSPRRRLASIAGALAAAFSPALHAAGELPVAAQNFVDSRLPGTATVTQSANNMVVHQTGNAVMLNWQSFSIGKGNSVHFDQASSSMRAINVVVPGGPRSEIDGSLTAKGQVFIFNQAGILFGANAQVDVGGLVGSTLKLNDKLFEQALSSLGVDDQGRPIAALSLYDDADRSGLATGDITVAHGARIVAAKNGRVLLAAPNVTNGGRIEAEEGQVVLAAGEKVYIADPLDSRLRGFLVEVDNGGKVSTEAASEMLADRGNITLVGLNIRHAGAARATTSVTLNGSIYLKARDTVESRSSDEMFPDAEALEDGETVPVGTRTGRIELAAGSVIDISPDSDTRDSVVRDDVLFRASEVNLYGRQIVLEDAPEGQAGASIHAPSATLRMTAHRDRNGDSNPGVTPSVYLGKGSSIDLSGVDAVVDADHEIVRVELRGDEVKDSPLLRDEAYGKALFGEELWVDTRKGTQLIDVSGYTGGIERAIDEKSTSGGNFVVVSDGDFRASSDSAVDLSGGTVTYRAGTVNYSLVKSADGRTQAVEDALADRVYTSAADRTRTVGEIVEGRSAGSMSVTANRIVLDGKVTATRTVGVTQRALASRWTGPGVSETVAAPQAGRLLLTLTDSDDPQDVRFVEAAPERQVTETSAMPSELLLRSDLFSGGIGSFELSGAGQVTLPEDVTLTLGPTARYDSATSKWVDGSRFAISATSMVLDGKIRAAGGNVDLRTDADHTGLALDQRSITFGARSSISTAGQWTRDGRTPAASYLASNGGSVVVEAFGDLLFPVGAAIDVSAGGWQRADGSVALGDAGSLSLLAGSRITSGSGVAGGIGDYYGNLTLGGRLSGYAVVYGSKVGGSGSLTLRSAEVLIDGRDTALDQGVLHLSPDVFTGNGFDRIAIEGGNGVTVGSEASDQTLVVSPVVRARELTSRPGGSLDSFDEVAANRVLSRAERDSGASLSFLALSNTRGDVTIHRNAHIEVDAGGSITLTGNRSVDMDGKLVARGGSVTIDQVVPGNKDSDAGDNYTGAAIVIGEHAAIDVSGTFIQTPYLNFTDGQVLDGGRITMAARRGYLEVEQGATLNADGTSEVLRQRIDGGTANVRIDSNGGAIDFSAREGLIVELQETEGYRPISARAGGAGAVGGALSVRLDQQGQSWLLKGGSVDAALLGPRVLDITQAPTGAGYDFSLSESEFATRYAGRGTFSLSALKSSGIIDLELAAVGNSSHGSLQFAGDVDQNVAGRLTLDAANIVGRNGADVKLGASVIDWRNVGASQKNHAQATSAAIGDGTLTLQADLLSVSGNLAASGFSAVALSAAGDLRASAAPAYFAEGATFATSGNLTLTAAQVYPTTASKYAFEIQNNERGVLTVQHSGATPGMVYSALGELTLAAPTIIQSGRVVAPFGTLNLLSQNIVRTSSVMSSAVRSQAVDGLVQLSAGSLTSVSASGLLLPYGQTTLSGKEWVYLITGAEPIDLGGTPQPTILINADNQNIEGASGDKAAARVDLSGGGDLQAWEWIPGTGGSKDVLSAAETTDTYAIIPSLGSGWAPYDAAIYSEDANGLRAGDAITLLGGIDGVPAGTYTLLPARYALLPGAFLVRVSRDDQSVVAGRTVVNNDGSRLVAARDARVLSGGVQATGGKTYVAQLYSSEQVGSLAEYLRSGTGDVFDDGRSTDDAGRLSLQVGKALNLAGELNTTHAATARGAQVDITAQSLAVIGAGASVDDGEVAISVSQLNALNAESLVLGGTRSGRDESSGVTVLDTRAADDQGLSLYSASTVRVDTAGDTLSAPDIVIVARDSVQIDAGSRISAEGDSSPEVLRIAGSGADADGAMLRVSSGDIALAQRDAPTAQRGVLDLGTGSVLSGKSVVLDSTKETINRGVIVKLAEGEGSLALTGSTISVGEVPAATSGLVFDNAALAALGDPAHLTLKSYGALNLYGEVTLGSSALKTLTIDAAGVGGYGNDSAVQQVRAGEVVLTNSNPSATGDAAFGNTGHGTLQVSAQSLVFGDTPSADDKTDGFAIRGYDQVRLEASGALMLRGGGQFDMAGADVVVDTPRIGTASGADVALVTTGEVRMSGHGGSTSSAGVGGTFKLEAGRIAMDTLIDMASGRVELSAQDGVSVSGSIIAAGVAKDYLGKTVTTPGGSVLLNSTRGDVTIADGALIDVSAGAADGDAGSVTLSAAQGQVVVADGTLRAEASGGGAGGEFSVDVGHVDSLDALVSVSGDFTRRWAARVRNGDTRVSADIKASEIVIGTDAGSLTIQGHLDASGSEQGGRIELAARRADDYAGGSTGAGDLVLASTARLDARANTWVATAEGTAGEGGTVVLEASPSAAGGESGTAMGGTIRVEEGASIDVGTTSRTVNGAEIASAARSGEVTFRGERLGNSSVSIEGDLGRAVSGARNLFIEGTRVYSGSTLDMATAHADSTAFMTEANVAAIRAALGLPAANAATGMQVHVRPHVEFRADGDFTISETDLASRTYLGGTEAGTLTVRAAGNLNVNGTLSDGFGRLTASSQTIVLGALTSSGVTASRYALGTRDTAWSFRLASGADTSASNALALQSLASLEAADAGDLLVKTGAQIRTGAGSIEVAAGRDLTLEGAKSAIFTAGYQDTRGSAFENATIINVGGTGARRAEYATNGGDVSIAAQRDISAPASSQTVGNWLFRHGEVNDDGTLKSGSATTLRNPTWYARIDLFDQGVATFGGGDITVRAGADISNLGVSTATSGRLFGEAGSKADSTNLKVLGGGNIDVRAGGDISSASFYVDRGTLLAQAGGAFGSASGNGAGSVLVLGDASAMLRAAGSISVETVTSATMVEQLAASSGSNRESYFVSYGADNRVDIISYGGSVLLGNSKNPLQETTDLSTLDLWAGDRVLLPASLNLVALGGDVQVANGMVLMPATYNDLLLAARGNVLLATTGGGTSQIKIADNALSSLPTVVNPAVLGDFDSQTGSNLSRLLGTTQVSGVAAHDAALNAARVVEPVRIVAEDGDITVPKNDATLLLALYSPQPVLADAGGDIRNLSIRAQHFSSGQISRIRAGGDIVFDEIAPGGAPSGNETEGIIVGGPGRLEVIAGGNVELANSFGIVTRGNYDNPALAEQGASILVQAGSRTFDGDALLAFLRGEDSDPFDRTILSLLGGGASIESFLNAAVTDDEARVKLKSDIRAVRSEEGARLDALLSQMDAAIVSWMRSEHGAAGSDVDAITAFNALSADARRDFYDSQRTLLSSMLNASLRYAGRLGDLLGKGQPGFQPGYDAIAAAFPTASDGSINMFASQVRSEQGGNIDLYAPGGAINVGVAGSGASAVEASRQGVFAIGAGEINAVVDQDFQVGPSRVFTMGGGDIQIWSSNGNIDAGKGSSTASATPPPQVVIRGDLVVLDISASVSGSGVRTIQKSPDVDLSDTEIWVFAPNGAVIAQDAGFGGPNIFIAARQVIGDNIKGSVSGNVTTPTVAAPAPAVAPPSEANKASDQSQTATASGNREDRERNSILTVELIGLGETSTASGCAPDDKECVEGTRNN